MTVWLGRVSVVCGISVAVLYFVFAETMVSNGHLDAEFEQRAYTVAFDWSAIQTGFLFAVYGYLIASASGFVEAIRGSAAFLSLINRVKFATSVGFVLTFASLTLVIAQPTGIGGPDVVKGVVAACLGLFVFALLYFLIVAYEFGLIVSTKEPEDFPG